MRKRLVLAFGVLIPLAVVSSAAHASDAASVAGRCPARLSPSLAPAVADASNSKRVSFRIPIAGASEAMAQLHRGLEEDDREALLSAETYFLKARSLANNNSIAAQATLHRALIDNDPALLAKARAMLEKSITRLRAVGDWGEGLLSSTLLYLIEVKRQQAEAIGGDAGLVLIREALADNDRLLRLLSADLDPEFVASRRLFAAGLRFELAGLTRDRAGVAGAFKEFEVGMPNSADPVTQRDNQVGLAGMLISIAQRQSRQDSLVTAQRARLIVIAVMDQTKSSPDLLAARAKLATLSGNLSGSWATSSAYGRDPCVANAELAIMVAEADLILAADEVALREARRRLLEADDKLANAPAYRREPEPMITLAESLMASSAKASGSQSLDFKREAKAAFDQAEQRASKCFCAFYQSRLTRLRTKLDQAPF